MPARKHVAPLPLPTIPDERWLEFKDNMTPRHWCHQLKWDMRLVPGWEAPGDSPPAMAALQFDPLEGVPPPPPPVAMAPPLPTAPLNPFTPDGNWVGSQYYPTTPQDELEALLWRAPKVDPPVAIAALDFDLLEDVPIVPAEPVIDLTLDNEYDKPDVIDLTLDDFYDKVDVIDLTGDDEYDKVDATDSVASGRKRCRAAIEHGTSFLRQFERVYKQAKRLIGRA